MNKKIRYIFTILLGFTLLFSGCGKKSAYQDIDLNDAYARLSEEVAETPATQSLDDELLMTAYGLDAATLSQYTANAAAFTVHSFELSLFKLPDDKTESTTPVREACAYRAGEVYKNFEYYLPDQADAAKNPVIEVYGPYVFFCIAPEGQAEVYRDAFLAMIQQ
jgi:hypothetical protein